MKSILLSTVLLVCMAMTGAFAAEIKLLSAGAVEPGVVKLIDAFQRETGHSVKATFATAPAIRKRIGEGETVDVVIAPPAVLDDLVKAGKAAAANRVIVGRVGVGITVRDGAPRPGIATVDEFKQSMLDAESLVYNQASTGIYVAGLFDRLGIAEQLKAKTTRYPDGPAVLNHVIKGKGNEIGFGATTEINEYSKKGLKLVGPLPAEIQNYTAYAATAMADGAAVDVAQAFVRYLTTPAAKAAFAVTGVE
ncbi:MAG TPA: substrate-binding domain-containing protein [Acidiferrobacterales bacterium]|nr:substrate-binding domain-containing protein [Acidiferrobacterales bacterium]